MAKAFPDLPRVIPCAEGDLAALIELSSYERSVGYTWGAINGGLLNVPGNEWAIELVVAPGTLP